MLAHFATCSIRWLLGDNEISAETSTAKKTNKQKTASVQNSSMEEKWKVVADLEL